MRFSTSTFRLPPPTLLSRGEMRSCQVQVHYTKLCRTSQITLRKWLNRDRLKPKRNMENENENQIDPGPDASFVAKLIPIQITLGDQEFPPLRIIPDNSGPLN